MSDRFMIQPNGVTARWSTPTDAAIIKGQLARGDKQSDVAAYWGTNSGRICETNTGQRYRDVTAASGSELPPPGPPLAHAAAVNIEITGVAKRFERQQGEILRQAQRTNERLDHMHRLIALALRTLGALEIPKTPRLTRSKPLEA
jgi:hypothetical protein